jgi:TPP-dependent pyruvate/acetoin dehydrogenase alpha subunit
MGVALARVDGDDVEAARATAREAASRVHPRA